MREAFANKNLEYVCKYKQCSDLDKIKIKYGLEVLYTIITKTVGILLISILLKTFIETIVLMLLYTTLRLFGHGIHAHKSSQCWVASILCYGVFPLLIKHFVISHTYIIILWSFAFICFAIWAPADTPKKPLINKKKRLFCKISTLLSSIVLLIITFVTNNNLINNSIFYSLIMNIIAINPLTYKLFNIPYNNYKKFNKV